MVWHTINKRCKNKEAAHGAMDAIALMGLPGTELRAHSGKGKAITKADLPALSGPEVKRMVEGHEVVMDAVIPSSDPIRIKLKKVWDTYIAMTTSWKVDLGKDTDDRKRATWAFHADVEQSFAAFMDMMTAKEIKPYMHEMAWHFPRWVEPHGCIDHYSASSAWSNAIGGSRRASAVGGGPTTSRNA